MNLELDPSSNSQGLKLSGDSEIGNPPRNIRPKQESDFNLESEMRKVDNNTKKTIENKETSEHLKEIKTLVDHHEKFWRDLPDFFRNPKYYSTFEKFSDDLKFYENRANQHYLSQLNSLQDFVRFLTDNHARLAKHQQDLTLVSVYLKENYSKMNDVVQKINTLHDDLRENGTYQTYIREMSEKSVGIQERKRNWWYAAGGFVLALIIASLLFNAWSSSIESVREAKYYKAFYEEVKKVDSKGVSSYDSIHGK